MLRLFRRWRRQRSVNKVKRGDGHALKPYRWTHLLSRSLFYAKLHEDDGIVHTYAVDVHYFSEEETAELYRDGKHYATSKLPAVFPVPGGFIEVAISTYGLKRMHFVTDDDSEYQLYPDRSSTEGLRTRFDRRFPRASSVIGTAAIVTLLVSLILGLPQLAALISQIPIVEEYLGSFESPFVLSDWLNTTLLTAGISAAIERTLMLRNHWLIDMETNWWDGW
ncbi:hypothetical protein [Lentibacillus sediminis]|uniref:hypothetical protein n=1 Tax=Lentibacillus sediminis TaxID=1940529 RepID=UPI0019573350|nr:hypothetical protein [Lentibacillus sediminis]